MKLHGVLLDVDGTLVDSNDAHARAWVEAFDNLGYKTTFEQVRPLIGMGGDKIIPRLANVSIDSIDGILISHRREEIFRDDYMNHVQAFPRVRELLLRMKSDGMKLAVASSARKPELDSLLDIAGVADLIEKKSASKSSNGSKPEPDVVQAALDSLRLPAESVILIGDTPYDVLAGKRAGVDVVGLRCGGWPDMALAGAVAIYDDPAQFLALYQRSPLAAAFQPA